MSDQTQDPIDLHIAKLQSDITSLVNVLFRGIEERVSPFGLAVVEYSILDACSTAGPITISGLSQLIPIGSGRISRLVTKLSDRNLIRKVRLRNDRRVVRVELAKEGKLLMPELTKRVGEHYANVTRGISEEELACLLAFVEKMVANAPSAKERPEDSA